MEDNNFSCKYDNLIHAEAYSTCITSPIPSGISSQQNSNASGICIVFNTAGGAMGGETSNFGSVQQNQKTLQIISCIPPNLATEFIETQYFLRRLSLCMIMATVVFSM